MKKLIASSLFTLLGVVGLILTKDNLPLMLASLICTFAFGWQTFFNIDELGE